MFFLFFFFFFFSSRRRHTRWNCDWSSDVCSSDLSGQPEHDGVCEIQVRVNYSKVDQMGVAYHARHLVWLDIARCEYLRQTGLSYRELEASGLRLVVGEVAIRYRHPAHYDDPLRVRCWVREVASWRVDFGY